MLDIRPFLDRRKAALGSFELSRSYPPFKVEWFEQWIARHKS
jgi:hypothetical protein